MKTTGGKTKTPASRVRPVRIYHDSHRGLLSVKEAASLKEALKMYYEDTLRGYGWTNPKYTGNTLTVTDKMGKTQLYVALEVYQEPMLPYMKG